MVKPLLILEQKVMDLFYKKYFIPKEQKSIKQLWKQLTIIQFVFIPLYFSLTILLHFACTISCTIWCLVRNRDKNKNKNKKLDPQDPQNQQFQLLIQSYKIKIKQWLKMISCKSWIQINKLRKTNKFKLNNLKSIYKNILV